MPNSKGSPLEIELDNEILVLRSGGSEESEPEPALLSGRLVLNLAERTSIKDISLVFTGRCKSTYTDPAPGFKTHTNTQPVFYHNFSFLPEHSDSKTHVHTLNAGSHSFPFSLALPNDLPGSLRTYLSSAVVDYRLKAMVTRTSIVASAWTAKRTVQVNRGLGADAAEFNAMVEIENTWPNKVMYSFTMPHKAYAAGSEIPVSIRFTPLAKGVRINKIATEIRENSTLYVKNAEHNESFAVFTQTDEIQPDSHSISRTPSRGPSLPGSAPLSRVTSGTNLVGFSSSDPTSRHTPPITMSPGQPLLAADLSRRLADVSLNATAGPSQAYSGPSSANDGFAERVAETLEPEIDYDHAADDGELPPEELHMLVHFKIPANIAPTNSVNPVVISHRIKWSVLIANPDGHTSELRCALPIIILHNSFEGEARLASSGAHNLLFGPSGALLPESEAQGAVDLPAYKDHVLDRVADSSRPDSHSYTPNPWAHVQHLSSVNTPVASPHPSRPPSPTRGHSFPIPVPGASSWTALSTPDSSHPSTPNEMHSVPSGSSLSRVLHRDTANSNSNSGFFSSMHISKGKKSGINSRNNSTTDLTQMISPAQQISTSPNSPPDAPVANPNSATNGEGPFYNDVPPYAVASLPGGVTPLDIVRSLPNYDDTR